MRNLLWRTVSVGGLLAVVAVATAQPPAGRVGGDPKKLKSEIEGLLKDREQLGKDAALPPESSDAAERVRLRAQLADLVKKLGEKRSAVPEPPVAPPPKAVPIPKSPKDVTENIPLDTLRMAQNLFKAGDVDAALKAFEMMKTESMSKEDRLFARYMTACCLRRMGRLPDAVVVYRELANSNEDEYVTECALWQLGAIRSTQELETQLEQLRAKRKSK